MKKLSILIPVWNKYNFTKSCLKDLLQLPKDEVEIVVVDNGSTDETQKELSVNNDIIYYRSEINGGFAKGCNKAYQLSTAPNVLFLNNDIRVKSNHTGWHQIILKAIEEHPNCLIGPTGGYLDDNFNFLYETNDPNKKINYMSGWCLGGSKEMFKLLKTDEGEIFSEAFGLGFFEDSSLSFLATKLGIGFKIIDVPLIHFGHQTAKEFGINKLYNHAKAIFTEKWKGKLK